MVTAITAFLIYRIVEASLSLQCTMFMISEVNPPVGIKVTCNTTTAITWHGKSGTVACLKDLQRRSRTTA